MGDETKPALEKSVENKQDLLMMFQRVIESNGGIKDLTENQVDKIISQRDAVNGYIHDERMQRHNRIESGKKWQFVYFITALGFCCLVMFYKPEYFKEILFGLLAFVAGLGFSKYKQNEEE